jgi:hypothetical protein
MVVRENHGSTRGARTTLDEASASAASRTKNHRNRRVLGRAGGIWRKPRKITEADASEGVDSVVGFAKLPDPRRIPLRDAVKAAPSLTSQQLERREDVSRRMPVTAAIPSATLPTTQWWQMNILRDAKDNDQFQWSLSVRVQPDW